MRYSKTAHGTCLRTWKVFVTGPPVDTVRVESPSSVVSLMATPPASYVAARCRYENHTKTHCPTNMTHKPPRKCLWFLTPMHVPAIGQ